jgi:hypothetical protein
MLLLLLTDDNNLTITLDNLFHISTGILEDKHERFIELGDEQRKVWFLHMGDMLSDDGLIDFENIAQNESRLLASRLRREKFLASKNRQIENKNVELIPLTSKKLVQPTDYLLCIRGIPTGYSVMRSLKKLSKFPEFKNFAAAATHHFVIFKLRENYAHMNVQFIHLILDSIVKNDMLELYNKKRKAIEERRRGEVELLISPVVITSIKEIKDILITIPKQIDRQEKLVNMHNELIDEAEKLRDKANTYLEKIKNLEYLNPTI